MLTGSSLTTATSGSRNHLAHSRLPDIDESLVRRFTWTRLDALQAAAQHHLQTRL
jgi:hypothetical protein